LILPQVYAMIQKRTDFSNPSLLPEEVKI